MSGALDPVARHRPQLFGLAYRMLGSAAQAEDVVQEAYARWYAEARDGVRNQGAFLTTVVTRLCLDHLKSARAQREHYVGPWLPEPPLERAVYLLREVFDYSHGEVAAVVGRSEATCRQIHRRARQALQAARPRRGAAGSEEHRRLLQAFLGACQRGDLAALTELLSEDVVSRSDGGGKARSARRELYGRRAVARLYRGLWRQTSPTARVSVRGVNGSPALIVHQDGVLRAVISLETGDGRIRAIHSVLNPDKLAPMARALGLRIPGPA